MNKQRLRFKDIMLLLAPLIVGVICMLLWWYELHQLVGWQGHGWLRKPLVVVYVITFLIVMTFLLPMIVELKMPVLWLLFYLILLYGVSLWAYFSAKDIFHVLYSKGLHIGNHYVVATAIWKLFAVVLLFAVVYFIPMRHFHRTTDGMHVLTILVAVISVIPASIICIENFPLWESKMAFIDAVKIGYPIFWVTVFLGTLSTAAAKEWV